MSNWGNVILLVKLGWIKHGISPTLWTPSVCLFSETFREENLNYNVPQKQNQYIEHIIAIEKYVFVLQLLNEKVTMFNFNLILIPQ